MSPILLPGLDAQNPLGFFAALGLLRVLDAHAWGAGLPSPKLDFVDEGQQTARVWTALGFEAVKTVILEDCAAQATSVPLQLAYNAELSLVPPTSANAKRDLKPSPEAARLLLDRAARAGRRDADLAGGFFSELVQANKGDTKPTAFHFTAGQQAFLSMVEDLRAGLTDAMLDEALLGPWTNTSTLPSLAWDSSVTRLYALRASDPSGERRGSVPGAYWLAVHALSFYGVVVRRRRLVTPGVEGGWRDSVFTWPVWSAALDAPSTAALLRLDARRWTQRQRDAMGVSAVFRASILRTDQGGYGSFSPAAVVVPPS